jgi:SAM-dependent methyltransferase
VEEQQLAIAGVEEFLNGDSLEVIQEVIPGDPMYTYNPELYAEAGHTALRFVQLAILAHARTDPPGRILDFACGGGRVLRVLKAAFPDAALTACDLRAPGVEFCERVLGATGVVSEAEPADIELEGPFDLIWSGSLLSHIGPDRWIDFVKLWERVLVPGGIVVFTAYGRFIADEMRRGTNTLNLEPDDVAQVLRDYEKHGVGYHTTEHDGDCLVSRPWVMTELGRETPKLDLLLYAEHSWLGQDVIACAKSYH